MKTRLGLVMTIFLFSLSAFAFGPKKPVDPSSITLTDDQTKNIADVQKNCVERDWSKVQCQNIPSTDDRYKQDAFTGLDTAAESTLGWIPNLFNNLDRDKTNQAEGIYAQLIAMLQETKAKYQLSDCQTACLAKCGSSSYADYDYDAISDINNSTTGILVDGKGVCENFATLATRFAKDLGLNAKKETGEQHAFLGVLLDGKWDFFEPETIDCTIIGSANP